MDEKLVTNYDTKVLPVTFPLSAWLFGKGPSLDMWLKSDMVDDPDEFRVCINETAGMVKYCAVAIGQDYEALELFHRLNASIFVLSPEVLFRHVFPFGARFELIFSKVIPGVAYSTAPHAIRILAAHGVRRLHMVGFDSWDYTDTQFDGWGPHCYSAEVRGAGLPWTVNNDGGSYRIIREQMREAIAFTGIDIQWEHRNLTQNREG